MATSDKAERATRPRRDFTGATIAQLTKLRALARTHPDLTYASTKAGLVLAYLPSWLAQGWVYKGDLIDGDADAAPITHLLPADGKLRGYCEQKPTEAEQAYCGTRADRKPSAARRLTFRPYDAEALAAALTSTRAKAAKAAARAKDAA